LNSILGRKGEASIVVDDLLQDNIALLRQGAALFERLESAVYAGGGEARSGSIGAHLRHVLDHYDAFLAGLDGDEIDYDVRARGTAVESDRHEGLRRMAEVEGRLGKVAAAELDRRLRIRDEASDSLSSARRELQFLQSHTVHHWAIVALLLAQHGIETPSHFGLAPSTLRYLDAIEACARQAG
jgi:uncharacterized damage-inducible protein DinB